ncbi:hypothetical protein NE237_012848 [Protea cynaroides]|uniref:CRIB domain-containing protein n=1 Tax=Protea cynaroides TaxID=273540 RepID=A0A9Q0H0X0_9MAGN|nr:hypothetical protein NE237_012848 [Protea cynaroides]
MFSKTNHAERVGKPKSGTSDCHSTATSKELTSAQPEASQIYCFIPKKQKELLQTTEMSTTMKGLLKGLRYISQIFDNEKEEEMQIGHPTDVKHIAHIGYDGSSTHSPPWMNEYSNGDANKSSDKGISPEDLHRTGAGIDGSPQRDTMEIPKLSRRQPFFGTHSSLNSSTSGEQPEQPRRHQSMTDVSISSASQDATERSSRPSRRSQTATQSIDVTSQDQATDQKKSRRKSKRSVGSGITRPSRSKDKSSTTITCPFSDPGSGSVSVLTSEVSTLEPFCEGEGEKGNHGSS